MSESKKSSRWKKRVKRLGVVLLGLALVPVALELSLRVIDPLGVSHFMNMKRYMTELVVPQLESDRLMVHRPNKYLDLYGWDINTNSKGLRSPERVEPKPAGIKRVLFVGDSVTFGWGVDAVDTFVWMVEEGLNRSGDQVWESINAGHLYHDSTQERAVLEDVGLGYEPDVIFLVYVGNDTHPTKQMSKPAAERKLKLTEADLAEIRARQAAKARIAWIQPYAPFTFRLSNLLLTRYRNYQFKKIKGNEDRDPYMLDRAGIDFELGWELSRKALLEMKSLADGIGAKFVVLDSGRKEGLEEFCLEQGLDFARIVHGTEEKEGTRNSASDPHPNRKGHRQYADKILRVFEEFGLAD